MIKRVVETKTEEYFLISREQIEFIYSLFLTMGVWEMLEVLGKSRKSKDEEFVDKFWQEISDALAGKVE